MKMKKLVIPGLVIAAVLGGGIGSALAITMFQEYLAGIGSAAFTNEVVIEKIKVKGVDEVRVRLYPTTNAVPLRVYTVELYGDDDLLGTQTVSWTDTEIPVGLRKDVTFAGLSLASVDVLDVDVVY